MSLKKKLGSKLAQSVRQVKSQQDKSTQPVQAKSQTLPKVLSASISEKASGPVSKPVETSPARKTVPSGGSPHPLRVWPD